MRPAVADYRTFGGGLVEYDRDAPCLVCQRPVEAASMGGTAICPSCDLGQHRDTGEKWTLYEYVLITRDKMTPQAAREALRGRAPPDEP